MEPRRTLCVSQNSPLGKQDFVQHRRRSTQGNSHTRRRARKHGPTDGSPFLTDPTTIEKDPHDLHEAVRHFETHDVNPGSGNENPQRWV